MFRLCTQVGCPHPDYLQDYLTSSQISDWMAYDRLDPIGGNRMDFHFATLLSTLHNLAMAIHSKKKTSPSKPQDFLVSWNGEDTEDKGVMSPDQIKQFFVDWKERKERQKTIAERRERNRERRRKK